MLNDPIEQDDNEQIGKFPKANKQLAHLQEKLNKIESNEQEDSNANMSMQSVNQEAIVDDNEKSSKEQSSSKPSKKKRKLAKANDSIESSNEPTQKEPKLESEANTDVAKTENEEGDKQVKKKKNRRRKHAVVKAKKMKKELAEEATLLHLRYKDSFKII